MPLRSLLSPPIPNPSPNPDPNHSRRFQTILIAAACSALVLVLLLFLLLFLYLFLSLRRRRSPTIPLSDLPSTSLRRFPRRDLRSASVGFDPSRLLGRGASASVFLGVLPSGKSVAIKSLHPSASTSFDLEFRNELHILSSLPPSPFVLSLLGFSDDKMLVYEYMPNGSLQKSLFSSSDDDDRQHLNWDRRFQIILDVARGLEFLHLECHPPVIHGDIKPSNVLLGSDFRAKIADFGLAKVKLLNEVDPGADGFSQDLGLMSPQIDFHFEFDRPVPASSSSSPPSKRSNFEGRVRCNPIATLVDDECKNNAVMVKGKDAAVTPLDHEAYVSIEHSKELNDGDWWWKQEGSGELDSRDYVREWIGSQICSLGNPDCCKNQDKKSEKSERKSGGMKEWWKEEYFEEMSKKHKCNKGLNCFKKCSSSSNNTNNINNNNNIDASFPKGSWRMTKRRSKSVGSELFSGDLFSRELSSTATSMRGTICYVAPEHGNCGQYIEKSDIYSFGVLILVIVSGRRPLHVLSSPLKLERANLISWCRQLASSGNVLDLVDQRLKDCYNKEQASLCINLALLCLQKLPELRPDSGEIVRILKGEMEIPVVPFEFSPSPNSKMYSKSRRKTTRDPA